ncbi:MAG: hypothetical protein M1840_006184 [Geoglossum simile]|nr:MAG: hypothetical protein M1840_006184 [Geoglossum simile]
MVLGIGDFVALAHVIHLLINETKSTLPAKTQYQKVITELDLLDKNMSMLESLTPIDSEADQLSAIQQTAATCRRDLDEFLRKIAKYKNPLGESSRIGTLRALPHKVDWRVNVSKEVERLHARIAAYNLTIIRHLGVENRQTIVKQAEALHTVSNSLAHFCELWRTSTEEYKSIVSESVYTQAKTLTATQQLPPPSPPDPNVKLIDARGRPYSVPVALCLQRQILEDFLASQFEDLHTDWERVHGGQFWLLNIFQPQRLPAPERLDSQQLLRQGVGILNHWEENFFRAGSIVVMVFVPDFLIERIQDMIFLVFNEDYVKTQLESRQLLSSANVRLRVLLPGPLERHYE